MGRKAELHGGIDESRGRINGVQLDFEPVTAVVAAQYHNKHKGFSFHVHGGKRATDPNLTAAAIGAMRTDCPRLDT